LGFFAELVDELMANVGGGGLDEFNLFFKIGVELGDLFDVGFLLDFSVVLLSFYPKLSGL
jgi:hypothetical protein